MDLPVMKLNFKLSDDLREYDIESYVEQIRVSLRRILKKSNSTAVLDFMKDTYTQLWSEIYNPKGLRKIKKEV